jgi:hypothetical protein
VLSPRRERGFEFSRLFEIFAPRFHASDHLVLYQWYSTMLLPKVPRLRVAFAINNNLNMKRNSSVVQLSAIVQLWSSLLGCLVACHVPGARTMGYLRWIHATGWRRETRGANPRRETEARNEK